GASAAAAITARELFFAPATRSRPFSRGPPAMSSLSVPRSMVTVSARIDGPSQLCLDVAAHELFEQPVAVDLPDQRPGILVARDVGRISRDQIAHDLVNRVVPSLEQRVVDVAERLLHVAGLPGSDLKYPRFLSLRHVRSSAQPGRAGRTPT